MALLQKLLESRDPGLTDLVEAGSALFECPMAIVTVLDEDCQRFLARRGLDADQTPIEQSFCRIAVAQDSLLVVPDTHLDARFRNNPLVTGDPHIRFYAGAPIRVQSHPDAPATGIGAFCVIDTAAREFSETDSARLVSFARGVEAMLQSRISSLALSEDTVLLKAMLADKERAQRQFRQAERLTSIGSWRLDLATGRVAWSEGVYDIHDIPFGGTEALDDALAFYPSDDRTRMQVALEAAIRTGMVYDLELDFISALGSRKRVRAIGEPELEDGKITGVIGVIQDVTERHRSITELDKRANTDEVTLIASRHKFVSYIDSRVDLAKISRERLALMLIDLDHFKQVNDTLGHAAGDDVLRAVAMVLRSPWLKGSLAARLGGDEFALVITEPDLIADLPQVAARLVQELQFPRKSASGDFTVSATLGCSELLGTGDTRHDLLQRADRALYRAKAQARGTYWIDSTGTN
ncbi:diguanylate cyclase domain-containing protein [Novosphingobium sp. SL115]|uniref:diguanylate cyclase domain-containing protein n=1 Tax=Novosphingobium sp. SL115 TaxID=2995150 RepID=UPI002DD41E62|nr:diguanylate cyclase [Novosphingobium sp. SL115]